MKVMYPACLDKLISKYHPLSGALMHWKQRRCPALTVSWSYHWWTLVSCGVRWDCLFPTSCLAKCLWKLMEIAVIRPILAPPCDRMSISVNKGGKRHVCVIAAVCHTPLHTPDPLSHVLITLLLHHSDALRIMPLWSNFAVLLGLLQVLCITADIGTYLWTFFFLVYSTWLLSKITWKNI